MPSDSLKILIFNLPYQNKQTNKFQSEMSLSDYWDISSVSVRHLRSKPKMYTENKYNKAP